MNNIFILENQHVQAFLLKDLIDYTFENTITTISTSIKKAKDTINSSDNIYNIFLLDIELSDGSGIDFAVWIRSLTIYKTVPIVFITECNKYVLQAVNETHCYSYILKPYSNDKILSLIKQMLEMQQIVVSNKAFLKISCKGINYKVRFDSAYSDLN